MRHCRKKERKKCNDGLQHDSAPNNNMQIIAGLEQDDERHCGPELSCASTVLSDDLFPSLLKDLTWIIKR